MLTFYDSRNNAHVLGERLGSGGEGTVYACEKFDLVAKIYHEPVDDDKAEKLRWMAENKNEQLLKIAAWVVDVLTDAPGGRVVGFLMPNVKAKEIHELYSLKSRRVYFPEATWHFLVHSAANLARAFFILHKNAHIMGDINHGNCVVLADGTVKLIDCDSYSIKTDKMRYPCEVGVATHLAPELQGADLAEVERENKHDNFGLAVIIFQLLFLGRHPFAGNYLGTEDKSLEDCIREIRFAYGDNTEFTKIKQPPGTLSLSEVSPRVAALFERAFWTQDRPEPREWIEALEDLSSNLGQCSLHPGHYYFKELAACPWCRLESKTGLMLFPFVTSGINGGGEKPFNIFTIENLIANLGLSQNLPAKLPLTNVLPPPSPEILEEKTIVQNRRHGVMVGQCLGLILLMALFGVGVTFFLGVILLVFFIYLLVDFEKLPKKDVAERLEKTKSAWDELENEWNQAFVPQNLNDDLAQIRLRISDYQKFQQTSVRKMTLLSGENRRRELEKYLRTFQISDIKGLGIDEKVCKALISRGVKTAAGVEKNRLSYFHSIDDKVITALLEWRKEIERKFEFNDKAELPETEKADLVRETSEARRKIEREIENLFGALRAASVNLRQRQKQLFSKSEIIAKQFQQAKSDAAVIGSNAGAIVILSLMTFFIPLFGILVTKPNESTNYRPRASNFPGKYGSNTTTTTFPGNSSKDALNIYNIPDKDITHKEIASLSADRKVRIVSALLEESNTLIADGNYTEAEQSMHFALRFKTDKVRVLNQLGLVLYEQERYTESLKYLRDALKIDPDNEGVKTCIGSNYLKMKRFADAKKIFTEVTNKFPKSEIGFYNLGLANKQLDNYPAAVEAFEETLSIEPNNPDALYNLGICFYKMGDKESARNQYYILLGKDDERAEKLRIEANLQILPTLSGIGGGNGRGDSGSGTGRGSGNGSGSSEGIGRAY